jgi:hypothetical protein
MSFTLLLAVTAAVAASMGYLAARKHGDDEDPDSDDRDERERDEQDKDGDKGRPPRERPGAKPAPQGSPFETLPLSLGDVVSSGSEERWLSGALVARENGRVIGALFVAPEGKVHQAVAAFAPPRKEIWWMSPVDVASPDEPAPTIEVGGAAMPRKGRLPVSFERLGQGAPQVGDDGIWAAYDRGRDVAIVLASHGKTHAWAGVRLDEEEYDRLGSGGD